MEKSPGPEYRKTEVEQLSALLEGRTSRLEQLDGTSASLIVMDGATTVIARNPNQRYFAASVAKLDIAAAVLCSPLDPDQSVPIAGITSAEAGNGIFDSGSERQAATVQELYRDMLKRSGNVSSIALVRALGGYQAVNTYSRETAGLRCTGLEPYQTGFHFGYTTPSDRAAMMRHLDVLGDDNKLPHPLELLAQSVDTNGIRRHVSADTQMFIKHGALNNVDQDGSVRHDVGYMAAPTGKRILVVAMSQTPSQQKYKTKAADWWLGQIGADIENYLYGRPYQTRQRVGATAMFAAARRSSTQQPTDFLKDKLV